VIHILSISSKSGHSLKSLTTLLKAQESKHLKSLSSLFPSKTWEILPISHLKNTENLILTNFSYLFFDSILFFYGGRSQNPKNDFFLGKLDLLTHLIEMKTSKGPGFRLNSSISLYNETLLLFGGFSSIYLNDLWAFDVNSEVWAKINTLGPSPAGRAGCLLFTTGDYLFLFGGGDGNNVFNDFFLLDLQTLVWNEDLECQIHQDFLRNREMMACCAVGRNAFVFGGRTCREKFCDAFDLFCFDEFFRIRVKKLTGGPPARACSSLCVVKEGVFALIGGLGVKGCLNDIWLYSFNENSWHEFEGYNKIAPRQGHCSVCYSDKLIVFGGSCEKRFVAKDMVFLQVFNPNCCYSPSTTVSREINTRLVRFLYCFKENQEKSNKKMRKNEERKEKLVYLMDLKMEQVKMVNSMFLDDFSAILFICRLWNSFSVQIQLKGTVSFLSQKICKLNPKNSLKSIFSKKRSLNDHDFHIRQKLLSSWKRSPSEHRNILKLSIKPKTNENFLDHLLKKDCMTLAPFFRFSPVILIISRVSDTYSVALFEREESIFHYFYLEIDSNLNIKKPGPSLSSATLNNILSRSHLKSSEEITSTSFIDIFLYTVRLKRTETGDIIDLNSRSLVNFMDMVEDLRVIVNKILCKQVILNKQVFKYFCGFKVFQTSENYFSVLMYYSSRLVFWEYKVQNNENCFIIEILDSNFINTLTGFLHLEKSQEILHLIKNS
jgi:hypothetical protein